MLHLIPLRQRLLEELRAIGREQWVEEECAALAALAVPEKPVDPDAYMKLKGARELDARGLAVLRELHAAREAMALRLDRPPFMIVGNESLVALAKRLPADNEAILSVPGCTPPVLRRMGPAILEAVARGLALPEADLPVYRPMPRPHLPAAVRRRAEALRAWRTKASKEIGLEPGRAVPAAAHRPPGRGPARATWPRCARSRACTAGASACSAPPSSRCSPPPDPPRRSRLAVAGRWWYA